ncbi:nucleotidyltransferase [Alkaliphilus pronyensis]|uniref:tRNA(Met) cytidine acetate ligase n=1 Tax=Alkaliphilus pronyensis TaxID=1482732 RepID=A0A6I0FG38_9FIRM|nr:nucleotidyltransferase [Alkaliphilus pronyensis]KAB3535211.1 nucleotidyltransferase [Alkaliphilus pronyensis]
MRILGLITEYNPFHNGHLYHLKESIKKTKATHTIAVMSGHFLQRGEPALIHKWARGQMAVESGVDLVIELPTVYACNTAELFAYGAVKLLNQLRIVDTICFGSEKGNIKPLEKIADILVCSPPSFEKNLKQQLDLGKSFPAARGEALAIYLKEIEDPIISAIDYKELVKTPNNILSIEYIKALKELNSSIVPETIIRKTAPYHSKDITANIASATAIRQYININENISEIRHTLPPASYRVLDEGFSQEIGPVFSDSFQQSIFTLIRQKGAKSIREIFDVSEGLENKIYQCGLATKSLKEFYYCVKSKRYPYTRLQRIIMHLLLDIQRKDINSFNLAGGPQYIRVLAFNDKGRELLKLCKEKSPLPVINKLTHFKGSEIAKRMLEIDIRATNIYTLGIKNKAMSTQQLDFTYSPIYVSK